MQQNITESLEWQNTAREMGYELSQCITSDEAVAITNQMKRDRKDIKDKPSPLLMPYEALVAYSKVSDYGNKKYGNRNSWMASNTGMDTYANAACRHLYKSRESETDQESGLPHLYHALWSVAAALWHYDKQKKV